MGLHSSSVLAVHSKLELTASEVPMHSPLGSTICYVTYILICSLPGIVEMLFHST